jgi:surface polysaccharide O-acyltransferase-like enzyme
MSDRILGIEYIRGIAMLGVVGIHTGAYSLSNPEVNIHLFALLEIFTRWSVPIFFFVSAFGLFLNYQPDRPFDYGKFARRRFQGVMAPYLIWSLLYMYHDTLVTGDGWRWLEPFIYEHLFFGLASYQLYFLVILIWFYALMPLWRWLLPRLLAKPVRNLSLLLALQIAFNYYSSFLWDISSDDYILKLLIEHRLSYMPFHYVFIFMFGAVCAARFTDFTAFISRHRQAVNKFFFTSMAAMLGLYYLMLIQGHSMMEAVFTVHQLHPAGVIYTLAASLYWFALFSRQPSGYAAKLLAPLSRHAYPVYLVHPLVMYYLMDYIAGWGWTMTVPVVIFFYLATLAVSMAFGYLLERAGRLLPLLSILLTGACPPVKEVKPGT